MLILKVLLNVVSLKYSELFKFPELFRYLISGREKEERYKDMHMQKCFHDIENSGRCRMYKEIKQSYTI